MDGSFGVGPRIGVQHLLHDMTATQCPTFGCLAVSVSIVEARWGRLRQLQIPVCSSLHTLGFKTTVGENIKVMVYSVHMSVAGLSE